MISQQTAKWKPNTASDRDRTGDVPKMRLSIEKLDALGWAPDYERDRAVRTATQEWIDEFGASPSVSS